MHNDVIDKINDRAAFGHDPQIHQVRLFVFRVQLDGVIIQIRCGGIDSESVTIAALDHPRDIDGQGKQRTNPQLCDPRQFVALLEIPRFRHRHRERAMHTKQRQRTERFGHRARNDLYNLGINHAVTQTDALDSQLLFQEWQNHGFIDIAHFNQNFA